ncbi:MAG TPA: chemotaxis protein CheW [Verrucomicrobia bacterium]|nr:MAG: chemotaxis protein CheW [Lentisphaerae bacterium GWF2_57_35]HBA84082.1 chemotaxis protein CheW [Verrucomicrobiota bacterium]
MNAMETTAVQGRADLAGKYLTFRMAGEEYGLEILKVQEIIKMMDITRVPRAPESVRGVINLRGKVIAVVDLRVRFGLETTDTTEKTCVIVVQVKQGEKRVTMGLVVDEVSEVLDVSAQLIESTPEFGTGVKTDFILGVGKIGQRVVMLLDVDRLLVESNGVL